MVDKLYVDGFTPVMAEDLNDFNKATYYGIVPALVTGSPTVLVGTLQMVPNNQVDGSFIIFRAPVYAGQSTTLQLTNAGGLWGTPLPLYRRGVPVTPMSFALNETILACYNQAQARWDVGCVVGYNPVGVLSPAAPISSPGKVFAPPLSDYMGQLGVSVPPSYFAPAIASSPSSVGAAPVDVAYCPSNNNLYVTNYGSGTVSVVSVASGLVVATIAVGASPYGVIYCPTNDTIYVSGQGAGVLYAIAAASNALVATSSLGATTQPLGLAYCPSNNTIYVALSGSNSVAVVSVPTGAVAAIIPLASVAAPNGLAYCPNRNAMYVTCFGTGTVDVIDVPTGSITATLTGFSAPVGIAYNPTTGAMYVANNGSGTVSRINTVTNTSYPIVLGATPFGVAYCPSDSNIYATTYGAGDVYLVDAVTDAASVFVNSLAGPQGIVYCPSNNALYVVNGSAAEVVRLAPAVGNSGRSVLVGPSVPGSSMAVPRSQADALYAPIGGNPATPFTVGASFGFTQDAVPRSQADALYAQIGGSATQPFYAQNATAQQHAVTLAQSLAGMSPFNVTGARSFFSIYQNVTSRPMCVSVSAVSGSGSAGLDAYTGPLSNLTVTGVHVATAQMLSPAANDTVQAQFFVPPGWYYEIMPLAGTTVSLWTEWQ